MPRFLDRHDAGHQLAERVSLRNAAQTLHDPLVLALPRGGVPVALEIAEAIDAPLDVLLVRKLGAPGFAELGLGAIVDGPNPQRILNQRIIDVVQPPPGYLEAEEKRQYEVLAQRKRRLRQGHPPEAVAGRDVILVDDGVATGSTMRVALKALAGAGARSVLVAVPVAPAGAAEMLGIAAERFECLAMPENFQAVGHYYVDFAQLTDDEVVALLEQSRRRGSASPVAAGRAPSGASEVVGKR